MSKKTNFPVIENDSELRLAVSGKTEIRWSEQPNGTVVCTYMVAADGTFDDAHSRECRGVVFDKSGQCIARPLHKFFNVNERDETRADNIDWSQVVDVYDKRDGSMIHTVDVGPEISPFSPSYPFDVKSKKSYTSDVANEAREFIRKNLNYLEFCREITGLGKTAIFEWTSPTARIVIAYPKDELRLLHVRDNITGEYMSTEDIELLAGVWGVGVVDRLIIDPRDLLSMAESEEGIEGWVVRFANDDMVKLKTKWYLERHRAMTFLRERDIALMVIRESIDDLKSLLAGEGVDLKDLLRVEADTVNRFDSIVDIVEGDYADFKHLGRKEFALKFQSEGHPYFSLLMRRFTGGEPDYKTYFERNVLPTIPLKQINLVQSVAEAE